jgi:hypothetical protein
MKKITNKIMILLVLGVLAISASVVNAAPPDRMMEKVRKELVTLPYYGVFDNLEYKVDGSTVTLFGQVRNPSTRHDAERRIAKIEGVDRVVKISRSYRFPVLMTQSEFVLTGRYSAAAAFIDIRWERILRSISWSGTAA